MPRKVNPNYRIGRFAVRDVVEEFIKSCAHITPYEAYLAGQTLKYIFRFDKKNGAEDLHKARDFLNWLIEERQRIEKEVYGIEKISRVP